MCLFIATFMIGSKNLSCNLKNIFLKIKKLNKSKHNRFQIEVVEDYYPLPGAGQKCPLPLRIPLTFILRMISLIVVPPHIIEKLQKLFLWRGLTHTSFLCLLILLLVLNFLPKPLQTNTCPMCCQILWWLGVGKDLKALSQTLQGWTLSLSCALSLHTDPIKQQR